MSEGPKFSARSEHTLLRRKLHAHEVILPDHVDPLRRLIRRSSDTYGDIARRLKQVESLRRSASSHPPISMLFQRCPSL